MEQDHIGIQFKTLRSEPGVEQDVDKNDTVI